MVVSFTTDLLLTLTVIIIYTHSCFVVFFHKEIIVGMRFGQFGREDNSLVLVSQGGTLSVKILRRGVVFEPKEANPGINNRSDECVVHVSV